MRKITNWEDINITMSHVLVGPESAVQALVLIKKLDDCATKKYSVAFVSHTEHAGSVIAESIDWNLEEYAKRWIYRRMYIQCQNYSLEYGGSWKGIVHELPWTGPVCASFVPGFFPHVQN